MIAGRMITAKAVISLGIGLTACNAVIFDPNRTIFRFGTTRCREVSGQEQKADQSFSRSAFFSPWRIGDR